MHWEVLAGMGLVATIYLPTIFGLTSKIKEHSQKEINKFFKNIENYSGKIDKKVFEKWIARYYKINEPEKNLKTFYRWGLLLLLFLAIDIFVDELPKWLYGFGVITYIATFIGDNVIV